MADTKEKVALLELEVSQLKQLVKMKDEVIIQLKEKEQEQRMLHSNYDTTQSDLLSSLEAKKSLIHELEEKTINMPQIKILLKENFKKSKGNRPFLHRKVWKLLLYSCI